MKINHGKRIAKLKKLHVSDGFCTRLVTIDDLIQHLYLSRSHAHKVINGDYRLKPALQELLCFKLLGAVPEWPGWHFDGGKLYSPTGRYYLPQDLEYYEYSINLMKLYEADIRTLQARVQALEQQLENAQARELRVYVNEEKEPRIIRPLNQKHNPV